MKFALVVLGLVLVALAFPLTSKLRTIAPSSIDTSGPQRIESVTFTTPTGDKRDTARWMRQIAGEWLPCAEFSVERFNHREQGEKNESQTLTFDSSGILHRRVKRENIEGIETDCGQTCKCKVWQTRTVFTEEDELYSWNESTHRPDRIACKKWYITQPNESLLSVCKKLNIPADRFATLYHLNPGLQKLDTLPDNTKLLIEKSPR